jgi:hypothetical protein
VTLREAIGRNSRRPGKQAIPVPGVIGTYKRLQPPAMEEGFDELYTVEWDEAKQPIITPAAVAQEESARAPEGTSS